MQAALYVRKGPARGQTFPISSTSATLIGRASSNHIVLLDREVSANHCLIAPIPGSARFDVVDARSRTGTRVNGRKIARKSAALGDVVSLGAFELELRQADDGVPPPKEHRPATAGPVRYKIEPRRGSGPAVYLPPGSATVAGRSDFAHLRVDDEFASEYHCLIALDPARPDRMPFVTDLRTSNGTYVNGHKVGRKHLNLGDKLTVGGKKFRVAATKPSEATALQASVGPLSGTGRLPKRTQVLHMPSDDATDEHASAAPALSEAAVRGLQEAAQPVPQAEVPMAEVFEADHPKGDDLLSVLSILGEHGALDGSRPASELPTLPFGTAEPVVAAEPALEPTLERDGPLEPKQKMPARFLPEWEPPPSTPVDHTAHYGFTTEPFQLSADPDYFYPSPEHGAALTALISWVDSGPPVACVHGGKSLGKTLLLACVARRLAGRLPMPVIVRPFQGGSARDRLIAAAVARATEMVGRVQAESPLPIDQWQAAVAELQARGILTIFLIDEAHRLSFVERCGIAEMLQVEQACEGVRVLLVGDESLGRHVSEKSLSPYTGTTVQLHPLPPEVVPAYVTHRLTRACGAPKRVFTDDALRILAEFAGGVPRDINRAAHAALAAGYRESRHEIDGETMLRVIRETLQSNWAPEPNQGVEA